MTPEEAAQRAKEFVEKRDLHFGEEELNEIRISFANGLSEAQIEEFAKEGVRASQMRRARVPYEIQAAEEKVGGRRSAINSEHNRDTSHEDPTADESDYAKVTEPSTETGLVPQGSVIEHGLSEQDKVRERGLVPAEEIERDLVPAVERERGLVEYSDAPAFSRDSGAFDKDTSGFDVSADNGSQYGDGDVEIEDLSESAANASRRRRNGRSILEENLTRGPIEGADVNEQFTAGIMNVVLNIGIHYLKEFLNALKEERDNDASASTASKGFSRAFDGSRLDESRQQTQKLDNHIYERSTNDNPFIEPNYKNDPNVYYENLDVSSLDPFKKALENEGINFTVVDDRTPGVPKGTVDCVFTLNSRDDIEAMKKVKSTLKTIQKQSDHEIEQKNAQLHADEDWDRNGTFADEMFDWDYWSRTYHGDDRIEIRFQPNSERCKVEDLKTFKKDLENDGFIEGKDYEINLPSNLAVGGAIPIFFLNVDKEKEEKLRTFLKSLMKESPIYEMGEISENAFNETQNLAKDRFQHQVKSR